MSANHRLVRCTRYLLSSIFKPSLIFFGIYVVAAYVLPTLIQAAVDADDTFTVFNPNIIHSSVVFLISGAIFLFVGGYAGFREDYNFLLAMSNTWRNQYGAALLRATVIACGFTIVSFLVGWFERMFNQTIYLRQTVDEGVLSTYANPLGRLQTFTLTDEILFVFAAFLTVYLFGQMAAVLSYRWGAQFTVTFWILFGTSSVLLQILAATSERFRRFTLWFVGEGGRDPLLSAGSHLLVVSVLLVVLTGLGMRRLPQSA